MLSSAIHFDDAITLLVKTAGDLDAKYIRKYACRVALLKESYVRNKWDEYKSEFGGTEAT